MTRPPFIFAALLSAGTTLLVAQETNRAPALALAPESSPGPALDWKSFEAMTQKNIFDANRNPGHERRPEQPAPKIVRSFTFSGTVDNRAIFVGEGAPADQCFKVGDTINGFKVMQVTLDAVKLAGPDGALVVLETDNSMRREENGPWIKSEQPAPLAAATTPAPADASSTAGSAAAPAGESDLLKKLRLKREQEDK
jgi:hypothetical protein